jgi:hypothetical protein
MLMFAEGKLIPVDYTFESKGHMNFHDYGILREKKTGKELGYAVHIFTKDYPNSFSFNERDFRHCILSKNPPYIYFQSIPGKKELIVSMERIKQIYTPANIIPALSNSYIRFTWEELTGEAFDYNEIPF